MDGSFCNQVLAQIMLFKEKQALKPIEEKTFRKSAAKKLDEEVASLMVEVLWCDYKTYLNNINIFL